MKVGLFYLPKAFRSEKRCVCRVCVEKARILEYYELEYKGNINKCFYRIDIHRTQHTEGIMADLRSFGRYLYFLRKSRKLTLRRLAEMINVSPFYLSLIENEKKSNPSPEILGRLYTALKLSKPEMETLLDLHAERNGGVSYDIAHYIIKNKDIRELIRSERDKAKDTAYWDDFISDITKENIGH